MARILLNRNATTGAETWHEVDDDQQRITTTQNADDILGAAAESRVQTHGERYGDIRRVALMPMTVVGQAMREGWLFDRDRIRRWVAENPAFRTFHKGF